MSCLYETEMYVYFSKCETIKRLYVSNIIPVKLSYLICY